MEASGLPIMLSHTTATIDAVKEQLLNDKVVKLAFDDHTGNSETTAAWLADCTCTSLVVERCAVSKGSESDANVTLAIFADDTAPQRRVAPALPVLGATDASVQFRTSISTP